jgi:hypothetical protein
MMEYPVLDTCVAAKKETAWVFDPGTTTGFAHVRSDGKVLTTRQCTQDEVMDMLGALPSIEYLVNDPPDVMVCEDYRQGPLSAVAKARAPLEIIGALKLVARETATPLVLQTAAEMRFWAQHHPLPRGVAANLPHAKDALRHAMYYYTLKTLHPYES